jgi:hypothetical protein
MAAETPTKITVGNSRYDRCPDVDWLRLQGSWTSYADPSHPYLATLPAGQKPVISFARDGRFNDEGLFLAFLHSTHADKSAEGPGSSLLGADPATNSQYLYVEGSRLTHMK